MERICKNCYNWKDSFSGKEAESSKCLFLDMLTDQAGTCAGCHTPDMKKQDVAANLQHSRQERADIESYVGIKHEIAKPQAKRQRKKQCSPVIVRYDGNRPVMKPFGHQLVAFERYKDADVVPLFFEMGCGKTFTTLHIAEHKFKTGQIKGMLVVAPNDVHRQWYEDIVNGVDVNHDGVMWQELGIDVQAQCIGGNGGQKELYPFAEKDTFKFVSVNVDTFSTPHKWEMVVEWANMGPYMIVIDEATVIKNPSSKRSQRLLYEFNDVLKRGKTVMSSRKKFPVRAVLTGTPVTNGPMDLWAIMEFVEPNFFMRNYWSFRSYYGMFTKMSVTAGYGVQRDIQVLLNEKTWEGIHKCPSFEQAQIIFGCSEDTYMTVKHQPRFLGPYKHADELKQMLDKAAMFVKLTDCVDMPATHYIERRVSLSKEQQGVYDSMKRDMLAQYKDYNATATNKLVVSLRLQQISSGFIVGSKAAEAMFSSDDIDEHDLNPNEVVWIGDTNPKLEALMRDVAESDKPLLILTRYSAEAAKIFDLCEKAGYRTGLFTGWKVKGGIDEFKAGELDVLVANSTKIARGFNLQIAHTTLFYSNTFSMETRQQAEFRTFRMGQKEPCTYVDYTACEVDDTINKALVMKKNLLEFMREKKLEDLV